MGDGLGLQGAWGLASLQASIRQRQFDRMAAQQREFENMLALRTANRADTQQQLVGQQHLDALAETKRLHDQEDAARIAREGDVANQAIPPGTDIPGSSPFIGRLMEMGAVQPKALTQQVPASIALDPTATTTDIPGTIANSPSPITGRLYTKTATQQQKEKAIADARLQQTSDASLDIRRQLADVAGQSADIRGRMADIAGENARLKADAAAAKLAAGPKLPQREDDTVVSIHQMLPMVDELLTNAKTRITAKGEPSGLLGQIGTRVKRGAELAAYKSGLAVGPDTDARIQLASLLQVLGTVPYLRGIRNMQFVQQIQQHLADPAATDESLVERLNLLKRILPGMEQAIYDVHNAGVIPHPHADATESTPPKEIVYDINGKPVK